MDANIQSRKFRPIFLWKKIFLTHECEIANGSKSRFELNSDDGTMQITTVNQGSNNKINTKRILQTKLPRLTSSKNNTPHNSNSKR